jgi:hypothetical protein
VPIEIPRVARLAPRVGIACVVLLGGCAHQPPPVLPDDPVEVAACSAEASANISLAASALPIKIPTELAAKGPRETPGRLARRLVVTFARGSFARGDLVLWSRLSVRTYGGTIEGWVRLQSGTLLLEATDSSRRGAGRGAAREQAAIDAGPGYITITRSADSGANIASAMNVDLLLLPGGIPIDEPVVRIPELWRSDGAPIAPDAVRVELVPVRHVPGFDIVEADVTLDYMLHRGRESAVCRGSVQQRTILVDKEAVRPPLWDVGVSSMNGARNGWLGFSSPASGVFRAIFESPTAASSFANWVRATGAERVGPYRIGLFRREGRQPLRPLAPVDGSATQTFRVLASGDLQELRTGPLGEP